MRISLLEIYKTIYHYTVIEYNGIMVICFSPNKANFIIKEVTTQCLNLSQIKVIFKELELVGELYNCRELRILAYNGWNITDFCEDNNPYLYDGKILYDEQYISSLLTGKHIELYAHNEFTYSKIRESLNLTNIGAVVQATGTGKSYLIARDISNIPITENILVIAPNTFIFDEIKKALLRTYNNVDFCTFQYLINNKLLKKYNRIYIDEIHHTGAEVWGDRIYKLIENNKDAKILGFTATPVRASDNINVIDIIFGSNIIHTYNLSTAMACGVLPIPKIIQSVYNIDDTFIEYENKFSVLDAQSKLRNKIRERIDHIQDLFKSDFSISELLKKHLPHNAKRLLAFCQDVNDVKNMIIKIKEWINEAGIIDVEILSISCEEDLKSNHNTLDYFQKDSNSLKILLSINMLSEGVHIDNIDGAIFLRKTQSYIICLQQLGRVLKAGKSQNQNPIIFDFVNNMSNTITYGKLLEKPYIPKGQVITNNLTKERLNNLTITDTAFENFTEYLMAIESLWDKWDNSFESLKDFYAQFGRFPNKTASYINERKLGVWCETQRRNYKHNNLSEEKINKLNSINFIWSYIAEWEDIYEQVKEFHDKNKRFPSSTAKDVCEKKLGGWCLRQRRNYKYNNLSKDQISKLNDINFIWGFKDIWDNNFKQVKEFLNSYKRFPKSYTSNSQEKKLGEWCVKQRNNNLSKDQIQKLKSINFRWSCIGDWMDTYEQVKEFYYKYKRFPSTCSKDKTESRLGGWLQYQNKKRRKGKLSNIEANKFESLTKTV